MAIRFEGDLSYVEDHVTKFTESILLRRGVTDCTVKVEAVGKLGDNYLAVVKRFTVEAKDETKNVQMVVKIASTQPMLRQMMNTGQVFSNEILVYNQLLPKYNSLQRTADVPRKERLRYPTCYGVHGDPPGEVVLLEDMTLSNFKILSRFVSLTNEEVRKVLTEIGKFHALSFALKHNDPAFFGRMKVKLADLWEKNFQNPEFIDMLDKMEDAVLSATDNEHYKKYLKGCLTNLPHLTGNYYDVDSKYAVLIQGDCWTNNIMFKMEEGEPKEVVLIDYQMTRVTTPAVDLMYMIFNCTDYETRSKHYNDWIDHYYTSFENFLSYFNLKSDLVYPRERLDIELKSTAKLAFGVVVMLSSMLIREGDEVIDFKNKTEEEIQDMMENPEHAMVMKPETMEMFKNKIEGISRSFEDLTYFSSF